MTMGILTGMSLIGGGVLSMLAEADRRFALVILFGIFTAVLAGFWVYEIRHPLRLEVSRDLIEQKRRGRPRSKALVRTTGEVIIEMRMSEGAHGGSFPVLKVPGADGWIDVSRYFPEKVREACEAAGWRFADRRG